MIVKTHSSEIDDIRTCRSSKSRFDTYNSTGKPSNFTKRENGCMFRTLLWTELTKQYSIQPSVFDKSVPLNAPARVQCNNRITFSEARACLCMAKWLKVTELFAVFISETKPDRIPVICMCSFIPLFIQKLFLHNKFLFYFNFPLGTYNFHFICNHPNAAN